MKDAKSRSWDYAKKTAARTHMKVTFWDMKKHEIWAYTPGGPKYKEEKMMAAIMQQGNDHKLPHVV